jgi:penicillin-binding protein 2
LFSRRVYMLLGVFLLAGLVVLARLAQVQIGWHDRFAEEAYTRAGGDHVVDSVRGGIYAHWGTPLARQVPTFGIGVLYDRLGDDDWEQTLSALTGCSVEELKGAAQDKLERIDRIQRSVQERSGLDPKDNYIRVVEQNQYHCVVDEVPVEAAARVRAEPERFPGMRVMERTRREYPNGDLAPHVVGLVQQLAPADWVKLTDADRAWTMNMPVSTVGSRYTMDDLSGVSGIERQYEGLLRGARGYVLNRWAFSVLSKHLESQKVAPQAGCNVYLTLREDFQRAANAALARAATEPALNFKQGALVMVDVHTGAILAAATWPSFSLETYKARIADLNVDGRSPLLFRPVQAALPPGSVFKVVTATAALQEKAITAATTFDSEGSIVIAGHVFRDDAPHGTYSLLTAITESSNIFFYNTGLAAGGPALATWARRYGLGAPTSVDWPYERSGQVLDTRAMLDVVNMSIGGGTLLCTPLQVADMYAAIANGGRLYTPHFLDHATDAAGNIVQRYDPKFTTVPVDASTLDLLRQGLKLVVQSGTASNAGLDRFHVAGKTGTADLGVARLFHSSFAGYAPYEDPKVAFVVVNERTTVHGGSGAAPVVGYALAPIWQEVEAMR